MQNFGLNPVQSQQLNAVEQEIAGEQAASLGITGRRLVSALGDYRRSRQSGAAGHTLQQLQARVSDALHELLIQRESLGIAHGNVPWVLQTYDIPQEILSKLGLRHDADPRFRS